MNVTRRTSQAARSLILLIHGLGAADSTWVKGGRNWIELILNDEELKDLDIGVATYNTAHLAAGWLYSLGVKTLRVGWFRRLSVGKGPFTDIETLSRELKRELNFHDIMAYENVIIVAHSMGGLVGIRYILEELNHGSSLNVRGFISLATPFNGSDMAIFHKLIQSINRQAQIKGLAPNSAFLDDTIRLMQTYQNDMPVECLFCYGTEDDVVAIESAIPHTKSSKWSDGTPLPGDHSSILDVTSHESTTYRVVKEFSQHCIAVATRARVEERMAELEEAIKLSQARCLVRLQGNGLSKTKSKEILSNISVSYESLIPTDSDPLSLLIGDFGVGKSLLADLMFQEAVRQAENDDDLPVPIYLKATPSCADLRTCLEGILQSRTDRNNKGLFVVVDGMDEVGLSLASQILDESRLITSLWPKCKIVLMSRPAPVIMNIPEAHRIPELSDDEVSALIVKICEREFTKVQIHQLPGSVRSAIHRPLFSILLGIYLRDQNMMVPRSSAHLVSHLVERCLERRGMFSSRLQELFIHLAMLSTDRGNTPIHKSEIGSVDDLKLMAESGLTIQNGDLISFSLPILSQWFAAQSLKDGAKRISDIIEDPTATDYWMYAFVVFLGRYSYSDTETAFREIVTRNPALASVIVEQAIANWGLVSEGSPPPPLESGRQILETMKAWVMGLGPISKHIAPLGIDEEVRPIGVGVTEDGLFASWYSGAESVDKVNLLTGFNARTALEWNNHRWARPGQQATWAWRWTRDELRDNLSKLLQNRRLPLTSGHIAQEELWAFAKSVMRVKSSQNEIPIQYFSQALSRFQDNTLVVRGGQQFDLRQLYAIIGNLMHLGNSSLTKPWPERDLESLGPWVWSGYSPSQLLDRTKIVYLKAFETYCQIVDEFLSGLKGRLNLYNLLPVTIRGSLIVNPDAADFRNSPSLHWYFDPADVGETSRVEFELMTLENDHTHEFYEQLYSKTRAMRPNVAQWIGFSYNSQLLDIFHDYPIRELAYDWIWSDLNRIAWVKGLVGKRH